MIRAVLWDFDGTLGDSTALILACYRHMMSTHFGEVPPEAEWLSGFGRTLESQIGRFARHPDQARAMLDTYSTYQNEHHDRMLRAFPGAVDTVAALSERGVPQAIVTSKHRELAIQGLRLCELHHHFPIVIAPEDVARTKPDPEPVQLALARLGVAAADALFVGDSPHDIVAGRAAGVQTAGALWGPFPRQALEAERPDHLLHAPADVLALVGSVGG